MAAPTAVIVDGYSTGNFLPPAFRRLGTDVVHVRSTADLMPSMAPPDLDRYRAGLACPGAAAIPGVVTALAAHRPVAVVAGAESGVPLADALSERLGLATNGSRLSAARRDKYVMIETLREAGLRCARQCVATSPEEIVAWAGETGGYPVVVKPLSSASTEDVAICRTAGAADRAARAVLSATTMFGERNTAVLAQSFLAGTEYIVDTVSRDGRRYVCGVWEYVKTTTAAGKPIYDRDVLLDPDRAPVPELVEYVDGVLGALGIRHGAAHAEVIMTPEGPALVEIAARLNGNMHPGFHDRCLGGNQADLTALAFARPEEFTGGVYSRRCHAVVHNTSTTADGVVESVDQAVVDEIAALPTVHAVNVKLAPGARLRPTEDLLTSPLRIFLAGPDPALLAADHKAISDLKDRVYRLRGVGA
ncbi:ATP-grasp domain-containing protein [Amycolatopsis sp. NPDC004625]|uniref:ATP-grasp domain-containing protein n=1 Tax=Amycolatopsis sp. NPDC004625 TaxID=3154670 RepID=UPI0033B403FD